MNIGLLGIPRQAPARSVAVLIAILVTVTIGCCIRWHFDPYVAAENHLMENTQAVFLMLAWWMHGWRAAKMDRSSVSFIFHIGLSLLMYSFLLRELDISEMDAPGEHILTWTEHILRGIGWTCWVLYFVKFFAHFKAIFAQRWKLMATPVMIFTLCGAVLMSAGWPFDKKKFAALSEETSEFIEESLELNAYIVLFVASMSDTLLPGAPRTLVAGDAEIPESEKETLS